jgi:hypothetical protein
MAFQGSLAELHLPDIIQLISVSGKTGVFHLTDGLHRGQIYLHDGQIVHAQLEDLSGEEAVYALAIWSHGDFRFDPGVDTPARTISKNNTNLLMEAARRLDEWRVLSKRIPSTDMSPEFVVPEGREGQINLNTSEWMILSKIDGHRTIKDIAASCTLSVFDVSKILYGLITTGLIRLCEPASRPPLRTLTPAPQPTTPQKPPAIDLIGRLDRVREVCNAVLGSVGESVVTKHYLKARSELESGAGIEVIEEAVQQIARATSILKGPSAREALLAQLAKVR